MNFLRNNSFAVEGNVEKPQKWDQHRFFSEKHFKLQFKYRKP